MAKRPYVKSGIVELEQIFEDCTDDKATLSDLEYELSFRKTARAGKLHAEVKQKLGTGGNSRGVPSRQEDLAHLPIGASTQTSYAFDVEVTTNSRGKIQEEASASRKQDNHCQGIARNELESENVFAMFIEALDIEAEAIKQQSRDTSVQLRNGKLVDRGADRYLYKFILDDEIFFRDDAPLLVIVGDEQVNGSVVSSKDRVITIAVEQDFGPFIVSAQIKTNDSFLIEKLKERLEEVVKEGEISSLNIHYFKKSLGIDPITARESQAEYSVIEALNPEQQQAVRVSKGSELMFLWGPPGTGKTHALAKIIEEFYRAGKRVLLTSNTNLAVDTLLQKLCDVLSETKDEGFREGAVIRNGSVVKEELRRQYGQFVVLEEVVARLSANLVEEKDELEGKKRGYEVTLHELGVVLDTFKELHDLEENLPNIEASLSNLPSKILESKKRNKEIDRVRPALQEEYQKVKNYGAIKRFVTRRDPEKLRIQLLAFHEEKKSLNKFIESAPEIEDRLKQKVEQYRLRVPKLRSIVKNSDRKTIEDSFQKHKVAINSVEVQLNEIADKLSSVEEEVKKNCRVLAATATQTYLKNDHFKNFDVVVVDEASMLILPLAAYVSGLGREHSIIAGDFRQLPPIVISKESVVESLLGLDIFAQAGIEDAVNNNRFPPYLVKLNTQYRMESDICELVNKPFYGGTLRTGRNPSVKNYTSDLLRCNIQIIDTSSMVPFVNLKPGTFSRFNVIHALAIRNVVQLLAAKGDLGNDQSIGVISPYKEQAKFISKLLAEVCVENATAGTVHSFQGNEKDIIIFDIADSYGLYGVSQFVRSSDIHEVGAKLMNVAVSRAKDKLIVFANMTYLRENLSDKSYLSGILSEIEKVNSPLKIDDVIDMSSFDASFLYKNSKSFDFSYDPKKIHVFNEAEFDQALRQDVFRATKSVVIYSAFVTPNGVSKWADIFRELLLKGIRIRIVSRPPKHQGSIPADAVRQAIYPLVEMGVNVDLRVSMHEKHVIIDDKVWWTGSLNALSHTGKTDESMLRITSKSAVEMIAELESYLKTSAKNGSTLDLLVGKENPDCPTCGKLSVFHPKGKFGPYFTCEDEDCSWTSSIDKVRRTKGVAPQRQKEKEYNVNEDRQCPECGKKMIVRSGRYGPFWGCTGFPKCTKTEKVL